MTKREKLLELKAKLEALQNPVDAFKDSLITQEIANISERLKQNPTIKTLQKFNTDLKRLEQVVNQAKQSSESIEKIKEDIQSLQATVKQVQKETQQNDKKLFNEFETKLKNIPQTPDLTQELKSLRSEFDYRITNLPKIDLRPDLENLKQQFQDLVEAEVEEDKQKKEELEKALTKLRQDLLSRLTNLGGGNANRNIAISGNTSILSRYTDINIKPGSNITFTAVNNNTTKYLDLTITGTGGGSGTPGGADTQIQFNDAGSFGGTSILTWNKNSSVLALGTDLLFTPGADRIIKLSDQPTLNADADDLTLQGAVGNGSGAGSDMYVYGGTGGPTGRGGELIYRAGDGGASGGPGGGVIFTGGTAQANNDNGGDVAFTPGAANGAGTYGKIRFGDSATGNSALINTSILTADRTYTLPDESGTIPAPVPAVTGLYLQTIGNGKSHWASVTATGGSGITRTTSILSVSSTLAAAAATDYGFFANVGVKLTLPTAVGNTNLYTIKNVSASSVLLGTTGGETIDGSTTALIPLQYQSLDLLSDNANWNVV